MNIRKVKYSTIAGISTLVILTIVLLIIGFVRWVENGKTQKDLDDLAQQVACNDHAALMNWAAGRSKDHWGNTFIIESNYLNVQFLSKGWDGKLGTKDDLYSKVFPRQKIVYELVVKAEEPVKPSLLQNVWDKYKSWKK